MTTNIIILEHNKGFGNVRIIKKTGDNGYEEQYMFANGILSVKILDIT